MQAYAINCADFVLFFIKPGDGVADVSGVFEKRPRRIETLAGNLRDGAVESHLTANFITRVPRAFGFRLLTFD